MPCGPLLQIDRQIAEAPLAVPHRTILKGNQLLHGERLQLEDLGTGDQRAVDREEGVLRGRPDQAYCPALDIGEQGILLRLVEPVDLVDEEQCAPPVPSLDGGSPDGLADIGHRSLDAAQLDEAALGAGGNEAGQACLPRPGRAIEDDRGEAVGLNGATKELSLAEDMGLTGVLLQRPRTHARRKRGVGRQRIRSLRRAEKIIHLLSIAGAHFAGKATGPVP